MHSVMAHWLPKDTQHCRWTTKHWHTPFLQFNTSIPDLTTNKPVQNSQLTLLSMQLKTIYVALSNIIKPHEKLEHPTRRAWGGDYSPADSKSSCISGVPMLPTVTGIQGTFPCHFGKVTVPQVWWLKTFMGYCRISNRLSKLRWWRTVIFMSHPVSLHNREWLTIPEYQWQAGWFCFGVGFFFSFQILLRLVFFFNLQMPFLRFLFFFPLNREKNPFSIKLSIEYLEQIWSLHFRSHNLMLHIHDTFVCMQAQISALWRTSEEALNHSYCAFRR